MSRGLSVFEADALREIGYIGANHAATALSRMIGQRIDVSVPIARIMPLVDLPSTVGGKERVVTGIYLPVVGDVVGSVLIVLPRAEALTLADLMPVREYAASMVGPDKDVPPITAYSVEGQFPEEVVSAYESFLADKNETTFEEFVRQSMRHDDKITASSVHLEWEEPGDVSPIGFGPRPER